MKIIYKDGTVAECPAEEAQHVLRHTAAHIMAQAIQHLYPDADFAYGPATEKGFYYDVDFGDKKLTDEDLEAIEKEMKKIVKANLPIKPFILPRAEVAAERVEEVITCPTSINDPVSPKLPAASAPRGELTFRDVSFQYPDARADVISGVNFTTHAGQMLGIIGSTGSGKSTLVQLIPRLYDVTGGSISLDGIDVRDMTLSELRRRIGYIPQQGRLFSGTVESNLKFAGDMVSDEDMRQAACIAQAEDFIAEREGGYDSPISQGGSNVSGGQRQRLAIARALAKKPEVLVFDDSFSALDYKTDARLREELAKNVTDAALVVVAQRIATIMHADQIIVLDDGHVVGTGTHEELLHNCPAYLEIAQSQLSAEELGLTQEEIAAVMEGGER